MSYQEQVLELGKELMGTPGLFHVVVYHDDWCGIFIGKDCTCEPDIKMITDDDALPKPKRLNNDH